MRVLSRGYRWPGGEPAMQVEYESGDVRPIWHVRPRRQDCEAEIGTATTLVEARSFRGSRCKACKKRIFQIRFPVTATLAVNE